jgi:soluble lytic murein transglycosylase-like protein
MKYLFFFIGIFMSVIVFAQDIDSCVQSASEKYNISPVIIRSIMHVESGGGQQYAVNVQGKAYYPDSYTEAKELLSEHTNKSFDVGAMQVNKWWFNRFGYKYEYGFDLCWNIDFGTWILAYEINRHGYNWKAIGYYHSPDSERQDKYIMKVAKAMKELR